MTRISAGWATKNHTNLSVVERPPTTLEQAYITQLEKIFTREFSAQNYIFMIIGFILLLSPVLFLILALPFDGELGIASAAMIIIGASLIWATYRNLNNKINASDTTLVHEVQRPFLMPNIKRKEFIEIDQLMVYIPPHWYNHLAHHEGEVINATIATTSSPYSINTVNYQGNETHIITTTFILLSANAVNVLTERTARFKFPVNNYSPAQVIPIRIKV